MEAGGRIVFDEETYIQGEAEGYGREQIDRFGFICSDCGSLVMPIFNTWLDTRNGRPCKVWGADVCRCLGCLQDSPCGGMDDYVEYL